MTFWAKADRVTDSVVAAISQTVSPYKNYASLRLSLTENWKKFEIPWACTETLSEATYSFPFVMMGQIPKDSVVTFGPVVLDEIPAQRIVRGAEWRPLKLDPPEPEYFKPQPMPGYWVKRGSVLDLSQYLSRTDIDRAGRIVSDAGGDLRYENLPGERVRLRGFNCTYGGTWDDFADYTDAQMDDLADQFLAYGFNCLRFHFFDKRFAGQYRMEFYKYKDVDASDCPLPETYEDLLATIDTKFLDRYQYFTAALRKRGIYYMMDVFTSQTMYLKAGKNAANLNVQLFLDERVRNHWKAAAKFLLHTVNPYTGKRPVDDPQFVAITCRNEQEHLFNPQGGSGAEHFSDFTAAFRAEYGADMPEFSWALICQEGTTGDKARAFIRSRVAELNAFFIGELRALGWRGFVTQWDMYMRNLEGDCRKDYDAVAIHPYHAHPNSYPVPDGLADQQTMVLNPSDKGSESRVSRASALALDNYLAKAAMTRVLGKPLLMTEVSHVGANRFSQEAPVMLTAFASLQDWQLLTPHADLITRKVYSPFSPGSFDGGMNPMARITSLMTAFGWQRGDVAPGAHAVSVHVPEADLSSAYLTGSIGQSHNALAFVTRVGSDYTQARNPLATLDLEPETYVDYLVAYDDWEGKSRLKRENDAFRAAQFAKLREAGVLGSTNRTDPAAGFYESETGEIVTDLGSGRMSIDAPRFQAAAVKPESPTVALSALRISNVSVPASILAVSLDAERPVERTDRMLVAVATLFAAENSLWRRAGTDSDAMVDEGSYETLMRAGRFDFSVKTALTSAHVYAVNFDGSRQREIPAVIEDGWLRFALDTSAFEYAVPYFEVVSAEVAPVSAAADRTEVLECDGAFPDMTVEKTGAGTVALVSPSNTVVCGAVHVREGSLLFSERGSTNRFWRFTVKQAAAAGSEICLGPMRLFDRACNVTDGAPTTGTTQKYTVHYPTDAQPVQTCDLPPLHMICSSDRYSLADNPPGDNLRPPYCLFFNSTVYSCLFTNQVPQIRVPASWLVVDFRIPDGTGVTAGYDLRAQWHEPVKSSYPGCWSLESSPDGRDGTWSVMDEQFDQIPSRGQRWYHDSDNGSTPSTNPYPINRACHGGHGFSPEATVRVDRGATLDCSFVAGGQTVTSLKVDMSAGNGVGTLKGVTFAPSGTIELIGLSQPKNAAAIPLTFVDCEGVEALPSWTLRVNGGTDCGLRLKRKDGALCVQPGGVVLRYR